MSAIPVQAITINPRMEITMNGPIFFLTVLFKPGVFVDLTSHMESIEERKTVKAPIAPPSEKASVVKATQSDEKGEVELVSTPLNKPATAGPANAVICWINS
jgi:hypothetical protein